MITAENIEDALRAMDPAAPGHGDHDDVRARTDLTRILASEPHPGARQRALPVAARRRPAVRRTAGALVAVAAAATAVIVGPSLLGTSSAYATWTAIPTVVPPGAGEAAASDCRTLITDGSGDEGPDAATAAHLAAASTALTERRGIWTTTVLGGDNGFTAVCVAADGDHHSPESSWFASTTGGDPGCLLPSPRQMITNNFGVGYQQAGDISILAGLAGTEVSALTYHSRHHGVVAATVASGRFALWMPGDDFEDAPTDGVPVQVTYRDGTTATITLGSPE